ncbi:MAG: sterol desaturase family protein [Chitinophagales bacterium]|nr:sterol desaturase family protein [Chitinophagales bacterium]
MENRIEKKLFVSVKDESVRMFESDFLNFFSKVHFSVPLFIFVPAIAYCSYLSLTTSGLSLLVQLGLFVGGILVWSIAEYCIHRFVFHYHPKGKLAQRIHFITHGVHHDYPQDSSRLVMPPAVSIPVGIIFYLLFRLIVGPYMALPMFAGFMLGYLVYDMTHYAVHHLNWKNKTFRAIKKHHMDHHYRDPDAGFGFTSKVWDKVFDTDFK